MALLSEPHGSEENYIGALSLVYYDLVAVSGL